MQTALLHADQLTRNELGTLEEELKSVTQHWEPIGHELLIDNDAIGKIRRQSTDPDDCMTNVLQEWLETNKKATWDTLVDALKGVGRTKEERSCTKLGEALKGT